jgi:hypothetical protein
MDFIFDSDVQAVAEFMQQRLAANRLVTVAQALFKIAPLLWGHHDQEQFDVLILKPQPPIAASADDPHKQ